ncbi:MAG: GDP-L-fucose synthase family protein [Chloroflexota bacterium]
MTASTSGCFADPDHRAQTTVLVTGGTGFLGRYVTSALEARGYGHVIAAGSAQGDLVQPGAAERLLRETQPRLVIHLAARVGGIGANSARPAEFFYDNLMMGAQLLHECWRAGVQKLVAVGTVCAYPRDTPVPFREEDLWNGYPEETNAPYGLAKKMLLVQSTAYREQYGFNSVFPLLVNLYGPGDNLDPASSHVIPALIRRFAEARATDAPEVAAWGDGSPTREFLYVADAAEALALLAERYDSPEPVNVGSSFEISIRDLTAQIAQLVGYRGRIVWDTSRPNGQPRRKLDTSRAEAAFGFRASTPFTAGLRATVDWCLDRASSARG